MEITTQAGISAGKSGGSSGGRKMSKHDLRFVGVMVVGAPGIERVELNEET